MIKRIKFGIVSLSALALLAACGDTTTEPTDTKGNVANPVETTEGIATQWVQIPLEDALQIFFDTFGEDINVDQIELDEENGALVYSISGWDDQNEYELDINAETGDVTEQESERDNDSDDTIINLDNLISPPEAMEIAIDETGNEVVESWTIEVDSGLTVYEVDMGGPNDDDITLNAETGEVVNR